jgi:hypothetical protein
MSDGKEAKFIFLDDLSQPKSENNVVVDIEKLKQWYEHCAGRSNLTVLGGTVMSKGDFDKFTKKEQTDD